MGKDEDGNMKKVLIKQTKGENKAIESQCIKTQ